MPRAASPSVFARFRFSAVSVPLMAALSVAVALLSFRFLPLGLETAFEGMVHHFADRRTIFVLHVVGAPLALALGAMQFFPGLRARAPGLHRWVGRSYALAILIGGGAGFALSFGIADAGATVGFALLSVVWLGTTAQAVRLAMARRIAEHRVWMIRSFALTFAAVTLRLQLGGFGAAGLSYAEVYPILAWSCWIPNAIVAEWLIARRSLAAA